VLLLLALLPAGAPAAVPESVGFNNHLFWDSTWRRHSSHHPDEHEAGANVQRLDVGWAQLEPDDGVFSPDSVARLDAIVNGASALGIRSLLTVSGTRAGRRAPRQGPWQLSERPRRSFWRYPPTNPLTYGDFISWLTDRYGSKLSGIEVWNEPNALGSANLISGTWRRR